MKCALLCVILTLGILIISNPKDSLFVDFTSSFGQDNPLVSLKNEYSKSCKNHSKSILFQDSELENINKGYSDVSCRYIIENRTVFNIRKDTMVFTDSLLHLNYIKLRFGTCYFDCNAKKLSLDFENHNFDLDFSISHFLIYKM